MDMPKPNIDGTHDYTLLMSNAIDEARDEVNDAIKELSIFVASHFPLPVEIDLEIETLVKMVGSATYVDGINGVVVGYMVGDSNWTFEVMPAGHYPEMVVHIPTDELEDYLDDIETAEDYLQNYRSEE